MSKTITANIPAKIIKLSNGTRSVPSRVEVLTCDDDGRWTIAFGAGQEHITEDEAIDVLRKASNWAAIRSEHFPMYGFHN